MTDHNLKLAHRRNHRSVFFTGAGVLCAVAITLAGCSNLSKEKDGPAAASQTGQVKTERAALAKSERARKAAGRKLAVALAANKTLKKELLAAKTSAEKYRGEAQAADKDIADLEAELAKANAGPAETQKMLTAASLETGEARAENEKLTKQAEALRKQLATAKRQTSDARAAAKTARIELATANAEIARLKAGPAETPDSSAAQQSAQPQQ
ncbi:hypothetical protein [Anderseniella sp. Alg231-50]|uniref:hypothetical protein n=1 Tax=Anderseniella sp. Alg231-50 TaxID=1922226 RepID=UPI000D55A881